ncbi:QA-1F quinic acid utilization activator QA-1F [Fusarium austroafricanum]|uniref:QA-1F quinic acid utilization activator QA-1F n=1 Tax=Fusarium austroafricanum TaxID=2364996 RepID=A0A8H4P1W0_9HYPO|nr:QA-1F quinic acid utilization activator QA-1F [Fusarium austroafricanum]
MPPRKRENDADITSAPATTVPAKRQRVSLACDSCRTAREKCDGARPHCGTCTAQNRPCSYTPASRKRGVQTGYLRTIELSLAWLFEQVPGCEGALHNLLTQNDGAEGTRILATKDKANHRLYRRWSKSRVHKDIGRLLSDEKPIQNDTSADDSGTEDSSPVGPQLFDGKPSPGLSIQGINPSQTSVPATAYSFDDADRPRLPTKLTLPPHWKRLIDIYISYTHSWFPILEPGIITRTALTYPQEGLIVKASPSSALHAQLWAVFAVSAFQDAASSEPSRHSGHSPDEIYSIARRLIPSNDETLELAHISSLLLQSLVLLGQKKAMSAWLLIGRASRLALYYRASASHMFPVKQGGEASLNHSEVRVLAGSFILDSLASLCLGQPQVTSGIRYSLPSVMIGESLDLNERWASVSGFGKVSDDGQESTPDCASPLSTFQQLFAFCRLWGASMDARLHNDRNPQRTTPEDLVRSLDARFSFCNSLIFGGSTPRVPSAYLLQGMFLAITLDLVPGHRPSLLSNFIEVVESCLENFGPGGTPPIITILMEIVQQHGHGSRMPEHDQTKWNTTIEALTDSWKPKFQGLDASKNNQHTPSSVGPTQHPIVSPLFMDEISTASHPSHHTNNPAPITSGELEHELGRMQQQQKEQQALSYERQRYQAAAERSPATSQSLYTLTPNLTFHTLHTPSLDGQIGSLTQNSMPSQLLDYDAILDELGSIDCSDGIDVDPQFMTNLGFAPGCDLGEMFQGDYGT